VFTAIIVISNVVKLQKKGEKKEKIFWPQICMTRISNIFFFAKIKKNEKGRV